MRTIPPDHLEKSTEIALELFRRLLTCFFHTVWLQLQLYLEIRVALFGVFGNVVDESLLHVLKPRVVIPVDGIGRLPVRFRLEFEDDFLDVWPADAV